MQKKKYETFEIEIEEFKLSSIATELVSGLNDGTDYGGEEF